MSRKLFNKPYREVTGAELAGITDDIIKGMLMFRKNAPFSFVEMVNLVLGHPNTPYLSKNSLRVALELFDFDLNALNSHKFIVEQDVDLSEALPSEEPLDGSRCYHAFFQPVQTAPTAPQQPPQKQIDKTFKHFQQF